MFKPENDGIDHINIYSKGKTKLGRFLSNFQLHYQETPYGQFASIEAYWYYLLVPKFNLKGESLRDLHGYLAKKLGQELTKGVDWEESEGFKNLIKGALTEKIYGIEDDLYEEFLNSELPFTHYYNYGGKVVNVDKGQWIVDHIEYVRKNLKLNIMLEDIGKN